MRITLLCIGKTDQAYLSSGMEQYLKRLKHYIDFRLQIIPDLKNRRHLSQAQQKEQEAKLILKNLQANDQLILLDENGKHFTSIAFAELIENKMITQPNNMVFLIGGPYGFDCSVRERAQWSLSLSNMTFSHQMVRLFFLEQLYRAMTIIKQEPYHHG